jgi:hypothetical protein
MISVFSLAIVLVGTVLAPVFLEPIEEPGLEEVHYITGSKPSHVVVVLGGHVGTKEEVFDLIRWVRQIVEELGLT